MKMNISGERLTKLKKCLIRSPWTTQNGVAKTGSNRDQHAQSHTVDESPTSPHEWTMLKIYCLSRRWQPIAIRLSVKQPNFTWPFLYLPCKHPGTNEIRFPHVCHRFMFWAPNYPLPIAFQSKFELREDTSALCIVQMKITTIETKKTIK